MTGPADGPPTNHSNRLNTDGGTGDVVQARDVHGGIHFHQLDPALQVIPRQLPAPVQRFVNRDSELSKLGKLISAGEGGARIIIFTGTAGVGKTSLALRWAHRIRDQFPGGHLYVNLRGYDPGEPASAAEVLGGFLRALGVPPRAVPVTTDDRAALYRSMLADRSALLLLDNAASVEQIRPLLPGSSLSLVIVTSRNRLSGLMSREGARRLEVELLTSEDSVDLLKLSIDGYRAGDSDAELAELAGLCARLPLALRIAAERAASRPLTALPDLIADLRDESGIWDALGGDSRDSADAVRTVFAWSYRALPEHAATLFRRLGLHPSNEFALPAASALLGDDTRSARRALDALTGAHLVEQHQPDRYRFHDLLRAYAADQARTFESDSARAEAHRRILGWYLHTADAARRLVSPFSRYLLTDAPPTRATPLDFDGYQPALRWYQVERENLVAAVKSAARVGEHRIAWQLAVILRGIYMHHNAFDDWTATSQVAVDSAAQVGDPVAEAESLDSLGMAYFQQRRLPDAEHCHQRALALRRTTGDRFGEAISVNALGLLALRRHHLRDAVVHFQQGVSVFADLGERRWEALLAGNLAEAYCEAEDADRAIPVLDRGLSVFRELADRFGEGNSLFLLAWSYRLSGRLDEAAVAIRAALEIAEDEENDVWRGHWLTEQGRVELALRKPEDALVSFQAAAVIQRRLGDRSREAIALDATGQAYQDQQRYEEAAHFHHRAAAVHRLLDDPWHLAQSLYHLAAASALIGDTAAVQRHSTDAFASLAGLDDRPAEALRGKLIALRG